MIALLRFFQEIQIVLDFLVGIEADAVNPLQHLVVGIALPVRAADFQQLEMLQLLDALDMRAAAQIREIPLGVAADHRIVFVHVPNQIELVRIVLEHLQRFRFRDFMPDNTLAILGDLLHFFFNFRQIFLMQHIVAQVDVIVKAVGNHRSNPELCVRIQMFDSLRQQMRTAVVEHMQMLVFFDVDHSSFLLFF